MNERTYHYNAFISYNHNDRDSRIAELIQRKLEHFRVPKGLRKDSGLGSTRRIFLDKGELEVGDLDEKILLALEHAEYLIVICSPESVRSPWVRKEIEYFLRFHEKRNILAVITEGEPADVLPDLLLFREEEGPDGQIVKVPREPLACDYRGNIRQANRTELPRLAAALIGCRYDDLIQRQRHYRMTRLAIIMSAVMLMLTGALGYFIWSNNQINENYLQSLREQSHSLALQSDEALNEGDRMEAIRFALQALPSEDKDRPLLSEAVLALAKAVNVYRSPATEYMQAVRSCGTYDRVWDLKTIETAEGFSIAAMTSPSNLSIWNGQSGEEQCRKYTKKLRDDEITVQKIAPAGKDQLIVLTKNKASEEDIRLIDINKGREIWKNPLNYSGSTGASLLSSGGRIWVTGISEGKYCLVQHDLNTGLVDWTASLPGRPENIIISPDASRLFGWYSEGEEEKKRDQVFTAETKSGKVEERNEYSCLCDMSLTPEGNLALVSLTEKPDYMMDMSQYEIADLYLNGRRMVFTTAKEQEVTLEVFDPKDGGKIWTDRFSETFAGYPQLTVPGSEDVVPGKLVCTAGSVMLAYGESGKTERRIDFASPVVTYWPALAKDTEGKIVRAVLQSGQLAMYDQEMKELITHSSMFRAPVLKGMTYNGQIVLSCTQTNEQAARETILQYAYGGTDPRWQAYEADKDMGLVESTGFKNSFISWSADGGKTIRVIRRSCGSGKVKWQAEYTVKTESPKLVGIDEDEGILWFLSKGNDVFNSTLCMIGIRLSDGRITEKTAALDEEPGGSFDFVPAGVHAGKIIFLMKKSGKDRSRVVVAQMDTKTGKIVETEIDSVQQIDGPVCLDEGRSELFIAKANEIEVFGLDGKQVQKIQIAFEARALDTTESGKLIAVGNDQDQLKVICYDGEGKKEAETVLPDERADLLMRRFQVADLPEDNILVSLGSNAYILGGEDMGVTADIQTFQTYNREMEKFYLRVSDRDHGSIPYCTLDEMMKLGSHD